jgi:beta-lactamase regulating signal transducer with metallopeptidase domain
MTIHKTVTSCKAIFDYALGSNIIHGIGLVLFIGLPLLSILFSLLKTYQKSQVLLNQSSQSLPKKLKDILIFHNLDKNLFLISNRNSLLAVSVGIFYKKIFLSKKLVQTLSKKELESVVLHEIYHLKKHHSSFLFLMRVISSILFFLPIIKDIQSYVKAEIEKAADKYAVSFQKTNKYVKSALRKMIISDNEFELFPQFSYLVIEQRINSLNLNNKKFIVSSKRTISSIAVVFIFFSLFFLNNHYSVASAMEEKITCSVVNCVQGCFAYELNRTIMMSEINYSIAQ